MKVCVNQNRLRIKKNKKKISTFNSLSANFANAPVMLKTNSLSAPVNKHRAMRTDSCTQTLHENLEGEGGWRKFGFGRLSQSSL